LRSCDGSPSATPSVDANKTGWLRDYETTCTIRARSFSYGAAAIALEIPLTVWYLYNTWSGGKVGEAALNVGISEVLPQFLSDISSSLSASGGFASVPSTGRIIVRGSSTAGEIPSASSSTRFQTQAIPLLPGDYVYDYTIASAIDGQMAVQVFHVEGDGSQTVVTNTAFTSGAVSQLGVRSEQPGKYQVLDQK
jgi:hypothetical protein